MPQPYIRLNGRYTAAICDEKATIEFVKEHLLHDKVPYQSVKAVVAEMKDWFDKNPTGIKSHTIKAGVGTKEQPIIVSRIPR